MQVSNILQSTEFACGWTGMTFILVHPHLFATMHIFVLLQSHLLARKYAVIIIDFAVFTFIFTDRTLTCVDRTIIGVDICAK